MSTALFINVSISAFHNVTGISQENYFPLKLSSYHLIIRTKAVLKIMAINCYCLNSRINQLSVPSPKSPHYAHVVTLVLLIHHSSRRQRPRSFTQYTSFSSPSIHRLLLPLSAFTHYDSNWIFCAPSVPSTHHSHHPSLPHCFIPGLKPSFSANPSHCSLPFLLQD